MARLPSVRLLLGFEAAARHGNYSRAADELCLSQSAISHQIAQLEEQIGQTLFRRTGRGVELTMAGKALQRTVTRSLEMMRSGLERISAYLDPGLVVIVCPAPIAHGWLLPRVNEIKENIPGLFPLISTDETARYVDELDVDITIGYRPLQLEGLEESRFLNDEWIAVCAAHNRNINHDELGLICLEHDLLNEERGRYFYEHFGDRKRLAVFDDERLLIAALHYQPAIAMINRRSAEAALRQKTLIELKHYPALSLPGLWIARRKGQSRSPMIAALVDELIRQGESGRSC